MISVKRNFFEKSFRNIFLQIFILITILPVKSLNNKVHRYVARDKCITECGETSSLCLVNVHEKKMAIISTYSLSLTTLYSPE